MYARKIERRLHVGDRVGAGLHILMVAPENDGLPRYRFRGYDLRGKVGGIVDVIRDAARALAEQGHTVTVVTPLYGFLHKIDGSELIAKVTCPLS